MSAFLKIPFFIKATFFIIGLYVFISILYTGQEIIVPIIYATLFAILLNPAVNFFIRLRLKKAFAIIITLLIAIAFITLLFSFLSSQVSRFSASLPILIDKFYRLLNQSITNISDRYNISTVAIHDYITQTKVEVLSHLSQMIGTTLSTVGTSILIILLVLVYVFMILFYQPLFMEFIHKLSGEIHNERVSELLTRTRSLIQSYLIGLLIEAAIVATLYSTGLLIIGIEYAFLLGIIGALLNVIPYLGGAIAALLYTVVAFTTKDSSSYVLWVLTLFVAVHLIDNSYIVPRIVASKVKINAFVAITAVLTGGAIWGVAGMFLAIPLTGVVKLIFDSIEPLKPWGFLLGDTRSETGKAFFDFKIPLKRKKSSTGK
jgi:predicted PurR-regulated permease PerM